MYRFSVTSDGYLKVDNLFNNAFKIYILRALGYKLKSQATYFCNCQSGWLQRAMFIVHIYPSPRVKNSVKQKFSIDSRKTRTYTSLKCNTTLQRSIFGFFVLFVLLSNPSNRWSNRSNWSSQWSNPSNRWSNRLSNRSYQWSNLVSIRSNRWYNWWSNQSN